MRIGIYTDIHCCYTSSILPIHTEESKYTVRLQMIIDTFKWMYNVFEHANVDMIVNCGDLFDSCNVRAEEISALAEALSHSWGTPEYHVLGNHDTLDKHRNFYSTALLSGFDHIKIVDTPLRLYEGISFIPYMDSDEVEKVIPYLKNKILFSHLDIQGSRLNKFKVLENGASSQKLSDLFDVVINGHIHGYQKVREGVYNIGASTSLSFADDSEYAPSINILDTETLQIETIENPYAIRFVKLSVDTLEELRTYISKSVSRVALRVECSGELKSEVSNYLDSQDQVVTYRVLSKSSNSNMQIPNKDAIAPSRILDYSEVLDDFKNFLRSEDLKFSLDNYNKVVDKYLGGK